MSKGELAQKIIKGSFTSLSIKSCGAAAAYFAQIYIANKLGAEQYGLYSVVLIFINFSALLAVLGFNTTSLKLVSRYRIKNNISLLRRYLDLSITANLIASCLMVMLIVAVTVLIKRHFGLDNFLIGVLVILIPLESLLLLLASFFLGASHIGVSQIPIILLRPVLVVLCLFAMEKSSIEIELPRLMLVIISIALLLVVIYLIYMKKLLWIPSFKTKLLRDRIAKVWLVGSLPFVAISFFNILLNQLDILMISNIHGNVYAGVYTAAVKVAGLATFILTAINLVIAPSISGLYAQRDLIKLAKLLSITAKITTFWALIILTALTQYGEYILLMFGKEFIAAEGVLIVLLISQVVNIGSGSVGYLLNMSGRQNYSVRALVASSVVNVIANTILIPGYGIEGAAYATLISTIVWNLYLVAIAYRELGINTTVFSTGRLRV